MIVRVIDIETTGLKPPAGVCELGWTDLWSNGAGEPWSTAGMSAVFVNPGMAIPPETSAIHGITDADVDVALPWEKARLRIWESGVAAIAGHNLRFEKQWLTPSQIDDTRWIDTYAVALKWAPQAPAHNLQTLRYWLKLDCDMALAEPKHRAGPDSYVNAVLLQRMLAKASVDQLVEISRAPIILPRLPFGKHKGEGFDKLPDGYLDWIVKQSDMDEDVVRTARAEIGRRRGD